MAAKVKFFKRPWVVAAASQLIAFYIRFCFYTSRVTRDIHPTAAPYADGSKHGIIAFWHGRMLMMPCFRPPKLSIHVMISRHNDGELIARAMQRFNLKTVRGSSSKGGQRAASEALAVLAEGSNLIITPDGPRGPNQVAAPGAAIISRLSNVPVIPSSFSVRNGRFMQSWDRFLVALPFSHIHVKAGEIITPGQHSDEELRQLIEQRLNDITLATDNAAGIAS